MGGGTRDGDVRSTPGTVWSLWKALRSSGPEGKSDGAAAHARAVPWSVNAKLRGPMERGLMRLFRALSLTEMVWYLWTGGEGTRREMD
jgi:hypothetical protein